MNAQQAQTRGYWMGAIIAVMLILAAVYWWRDDLGRWISGTPPVETEQTNSSRTDNPEVVDAPQGQQPEAAVAPPEGADAPASTD